MTTRRGLGAGAADARPRRDLRRLRACFPKRERQERARGVFQEVLLKVRAVESYTFRRGSDWWCSERATHTSSSPRSRVSPEFRKRTPFEIPRPSVRRRYPRAISRGTATSTRLFEEEKRETREKEGPLNLLTDTFQTPLIHTLKSSLFPQRDATVSPRSRVRGHETGAPDLCGGLPVRRRHRCTLVCVSFKNEGTIVSYIKSPRFGQRSETWRQHRTKAQVRGKAFHEHDRKKDTRASNKLKIQPSLLKGVGR